MFHKEDFKKVGYRIFVVNSISIPGRIVSRSYVFSKSMAFLFANMYSTIFIKI